MPASFVTRVPDNDLGESAIRFLQAFGVDTSGIGVAPGRLGIHATTEGRACGSSWRFTTRANHARRRARRSSPVRQSRRTKIDS